MRSPWLHVARILVPLSVLALNGCFSFRLPPLDHPPEAIRLLNIPDAPIHLQLHVGESTNAVGHQFVCGFLPVTRIYAPHIERDVATHLAIEAASRHYKLEQHGTSSDVTHPRLTVTVSDLSISGYDAIFVRRPCASISLTGILEVPDRAQRRCEVLAESVTTTRFAFSAELNQVLQEALQTSARDLFDCLGL